MPQQKSDIVTVNHKKGLSEYSSTVVKIPIFVEISIKMRKKKISPHHLSTTKILPLGPPRHLFLIEFAKVAVQH